MTFPDGFLSVFEALQWDFPFLSSRCGRCGGIRDRYCWRRPSSSCFPDHSDMPARLFDGGAILPRNEMKAAVEEKAGNRTRALVVVSLVGAILLFEWWMPP